MYAKTLIAFAVLISLSFVGNVFLQKNFSKRLAQEAAVDLRDGDYLSSLTKYQAVAERPFGELATEAENKIEESKELLVAEVNFKKAKEAAGEGDWLEAKALLTGDPSMINTSFAYYQEAIDLFLEASEKVSALEQKISAELNQFKLEAVEEKKLRENAEVQIAEKESQLQTTIAEKAKTEEVLRGEIVQKSSEAEKAKAQAEMERLQKFKNELDVYLSMLARGNSFLDDALAEIGNGKDTTALLFVGQGKALFDEAKVRGEDMLSERTPEDLKTYAQKLLQAVSLLIDSSRRMGSMVFYIGKEDESEFKTLKQEITERRNTASALTQELQDFVR